MHKQKVLANVDKLCYLRNMLEGVPYNTIAGFALTESNYEEAVKLLRERFGRRDLIVNSHMDSLANIKPITSGNYGALLIPLLLKKLPNDIRLIIGRKIDPESGTMSLMMLLNFLKIEIMARERCHVSGKETVTKFKVESPKRHTNVKKFQSVLQH